ncbi:hypothetical protein A3Q56_04536 [Intoshia linei]|uniref:E3 ubiquitin-protein ligase RBBP6 n=1 Tax=Intoshia linei TaxID=1819745 RepID=A0A177B1Y5_9BILA|nr:hypothetical protein A3Q56_04536 [Intoshia linei]
MSKIHYKFRSNKDYQSITFDGASISIENVKDLIMNQKKMATNGFDLQISDALTKQVYTEMSTRIKKNTSVLVARVPVGGLVLEKSVEECSRSQKDIENERLTMLNKLKNVGDFSTIDPNEEAKVMAIINQSSANYDKSAYAPPKIPGPTYICFKCGVRGHFIQDCPNPNSAFGKPKVPMASGIPSDQMVLVKDSNIYGAMLNNHGEYAVNIMDLQAHMYSQAERVPKQNNIKGPSNPNPDIKIPAELLCYICKNLLLEAVIMPCCGVSFCDECIRNKLIKEKKCTCNDIMLTDSLIANQQLRQAVSTFTREMDMTVIAIRRTVESKNKSISNKVFADQESLKSLTPRNDSINSDDIKDLKNIGNIKLEKDKDNSSISTLSSKSDVKNNKIPNVTNTPVPYMMNTCPPNMMNYYMNQNMMMNYERMMPQAYSKMYNWPMVNPFQQIQSNHNAYYKSNSRPNKYDRPLNEGRRYRSDKYRDDYYDKYRYKRRSCSSRYYSSDRSISRDRNTYKKRDQSHSRDRSRSYSRRRSYRRNSRYSHSRYSSEYSSSRSPSIDRRRRDVSSPLRKKSRKPFIPRKMTTNLLSADSISDYSMSDSDNRKRDKEKRHKKHTKDDSRHRKDTKNMKRKDYRIDKEVKVDKTVKRKEKLDNILKHDDKDSVKLPKKESDKNDKVIKLADIKIKRLSKNVKKTSLKVDELDVIESKLKGVTEIKTAKIDNNENDELVNYEKRSKPKSLTNGINGDSEMNNKSKAKESKRSHDEKNLKKRRNSDKNDKDSNSHSEHIRLKDDKKHKNEEYDVFKRKPITSNNSRSIKINVSGKSLSKYSKKNDIVNLKPVNPPKPQKLEINVIKLDKTKFPENIKCSENEKVSNVSKIHFKPKEIDKNDLKLFQKLEKQKPTVNLEIHQVEVNNVKNKKEKKSDKNLNSIKITKNSTIASPVAHTASVYDRLGEKVKIDNDKNLRISTKSKDSSLGHKKRKSETSINRKISSSVVCVKKDKAKRSKRRQSSKSPERKNKLPKREDKPKIEQLIKSKEDKSEKRKISSKSEKNYKTEKTEHSKHEPSKHERIRRDISKHVLSARKDKIKSPHKKSSNRHEEKQMYKS